MYILENVPLSGYSTMRLGGNARYLTEVNTRTELTEVLEWADKSALPIIMIGVGSNIVWGDEGYNGLVIVNRILRYETFAESDEGIYVTVGGGENWDSVVGRTVDMGYSGMEQLSLIPGTAGATPVQNVGAYGREVSDIITTVEVYDRKEKKYLMLRASECEFGYRTSRFKTIDKNRFFITAVTFHLSKTKPKPPFYASLQAFLDGHKITDYTPKNIRDAVILIRQSKLPDPGFVPNNGSFFKNPIINQGQFTQLRAAFSNIKYWNVDDDHVKISGAWLIESVGLKAYQDKETGISVWPGQPLVLINEHAKNTADLLKFRQKVIEAVKQKFGITLEQEPELIHT